MKDRKRVMCGGLAFSDCEDMVMLHQYAKEGWVFEKFRGMCYILQKQEPVNRIFSYDMQKLKEDEKEAYFQLLFHIFCEGIKRRLAYHKSRGKRCLLFLG